MAKRRWTILVVPHDGTTDNKSLRISGTAVAVVAGAVLAVVASVLIAATAVVSHSVALSHTWRLERVHRALALQVSALAARAGSLSAGVAAAARADRRARLVAGLAPLSPQVEQAGIGGPVGAWPDRDRLLTEGGPVGRVAFGVHTTLDALIRQADILATSYRNSADSLKAHLKEIAATPSIMPTMGFITSRFASIRFHPILHVDRPHEGLDIAAAYGTRILAPASGRVIQVGWESGYGLMVVVDHGYGLETRYAHMSRTVARVGQEVKRGDLLGYVGSTGLSTGPHLHYEVRLHGRAVDPLKYVLPDDYGD
jgi:murein DD-endopeptidase MepM/ murein hydrolase activator NlpD